MLSFFILALFYAIFFCLVFVIAYYVRLLPSKENYSRRELAGAGSFFLSVSNVLFSRFGALPFITSFFSISAFSVIFTMTANHWIFNSLFSSCVVSAAVIVLSARPQGDVGRLNGFWGMASRFVDRYTYLISFSYLCGFCASLSFIRTLDRIDFAYYSFNLFPALVLMLFFLLALLKRYYDPIEKK